MMTYNRQLEQHLRAKLEDILVTAEEKLRAWATALVEDQRKPGRPRGRRTLATCRTKVRKLLGGAEPLFRWKVTEPDGVPSRWRGVGTRWRSISGRWGSDGP